MLEMAAVPMEASRATHAAPVKVGALSRVVGVTPVTSCHTCGHAHGRCGLSYRRRFRVHRMQNDLLRAVVQVAKACDAASGVQRDHNALGSKMSHVSILSRDVSDL